MNPHPLTKYRPAFTAEQINHIIKQLLAPDENQTNQPIVELSKQIVRILTPLLAKIEIGAINPAYKLSETHAIRKSENNERVRYESGQMSAEEETAYEQTILG